MSTTVACILTLGIAVLSALRPSVEATSPLT